MITPPVNDFKRRAKNAHSIAGVLSVRFKLMFLRYQCRDDL